ncbi:MAG: hypothetical protein Kow002_21000 [Anaerolineales bacterium]
MDHKENSPLTKQEKRILQLVSQGLTNKEIALSLNITSRTVEFHLKNVFQKLGVTSRTAAAILGEKLKLFD